MLSFYLRERGLSVPITGLDIDGRKVRQALQAAGNQYDGLEFRKFDISEALPAFSGNAALLDVLHYLAPPVQRQLLAQLAARVALNGTLLLRDSPRENTARFGMTYAGELFAQAISWNWRTKLHFASARFIEAAFPSEEFTRESQAAYGRTPFNNRLFIFHRRSPATAPESAAHTDSRAPQWWRA